MPDLRDISNKRFGRLVAVNPQRINGRLFWKCQCDCGNITTVRQYSLLNGNTKSCGCYSKEVTMKRTYKHGMTRTKLYSTWNEIKQRCNNKNSLSYKYYGAKGISICPEWTDYRNFYNWAIETGYKEDLTIERIDVSKDYCPNNCKWIPLSEQSKNKSNTIYIEYNGETKSLCDWASLIGVSRRTLYSRIKKKHWPIERALTQSKRNREHFLTYNNKTMSVTEWAKELGIKRSTLFGRIRKGWSVERILTEPVKQQK